jgi:hypothetical protein
MKLHRVVAVGAVLLVVMSMPFAGWTAKQRTETETYTVGLDGAVDCQTNTGGACFDLAGNETAVQLSIADVTEMPVGAVYQLNDDSGATHAQGLFCETVDLPLPEAATEILVFVAGPAFGLLSCGSQGSVGAGTTGTITAVFSTRGSINSGGPNEFDTERECLEPVPDSAGIAGVTDEGQDVSLDVYVLLDGVSPERGEAVFAQAAKSYSPLGITMNWKMRAVSFIGDDATNLISQAKSVFQGQRPNKFDIVYILTSKDIQVFGQYGVAGLADCIGGVRFPERAFAVGEVIPFEDLAVGPLTFYVNATAETAAHEIGHLMGGHHHYANCVEGAPAGLEDGEPAPCTLMFNSLDFMARPFGQVNAAIVRGHAVNYASP